MKMNHLKNKRPICSESGSWDGFRSEPLLVYTGKGEYLVATAYSDTIEGTNHLFFYDKEDYGVDYVTHWSYLPQINEWK